MTLEKVVVLLSTYNGDQYIEEQINSIINQKNVIVDIIIRDDGSHDNTLSILKKYQKKYTFIKLIEGENIGSCGSFFSLMEYAQKHYTQKYYAFSDQDDFWEEYKLYNALLRLNEINSPCLYCSNLKVVNKDLKFIKLMYDNSPIIEKHSSLLTNFATGCTTVINRELLDLCCSLKNPKFAVMHDWWLYCLANYFGTIIYDNNAYILYRQHGNNVYGARLLTNRDRIKNFIQSILHPCNQHYREEAAIEFLECTRHLLGSTDRKIIKKVTCYRQSLINRCILAFDFKNFTKLSFKIRLRILFGIV